MMKSPITALITFSLSLTVISCGVPIQNMKSTQPIMALEAQRDQSFKYTLLSSPNFSIKTYLDELKKKNTPLEIEVPDNGQPILLTEANKLLLNSGNQFAQTHRAYALGWYLADKTAFNISTQGVKANELIIKASRPDAETTLTLIAGKEKVVIKLITKARQAEVKKLAEERLTQRKKELAAQVEPVKPTNLTLKRPEKTDFNKGGSAEIVVEGIEDHHFVAVGWYNPNKEGYKVTKTKPNVLTVTALKNNAKTNLTVIVGDKKETIRFSNGSSEIPSITLTSGLPIPTGKEHLQISNKYVDNFVFLELNASINNPPDNNSSGDPICSTTIEKINGNLNVFEDSHNCEDIGPEPCSLFTFRSDHMDNTKVGDIFKYQATLSCKGFPAQKSNILSFIRTGLEDETAKLKEENKPEDNTSNFPPPTDLELKAWSTNELTIEWQFPDNFPPHSYKVFLNDAEVAKDRTSKIYKFNGLKPDTEYQLAIQAVYKEGSSEKVSITEKTTVTGRSGIGNHGNGGAGGATNTTVVATTPATPASTCATVPAGVKVVDAAATGTGNGSTWTNAFTTIAAALASPPNTAIWVKAGTYIEEGLTLVNDVDLLGGFDCNETAANQATPKTNVTIIDGSGVGTNSILTATNLANNTLVSGFTIQNSAGAANGGGLNINNSLITLSNNIFHTNAATTNGAGVFITGTRNVTINRNVFRNNTAGEYGGGLYDETTTAATVNVFNNIFRSNTASVFDGGGIAMSFNGTANDNMKIINNVFFMNTATLGNGGGIAFIDGFAEDTNASILNNIFVGNTVPGGGGAHLYLAANSFSSVVTYNFNIFDNMTATTHIHKPGPGGALNDGGTANNITNATPFATVGDPDGVDNVDGTADDGLALNGGLGNTGTNTTANGVTEDILGNARPVGATHDIGAFEVE